VALLVAWALCGPSPAEAAPVRVRLAEGVARGFLVVRSLDGVEIGHGELRQKPVGGMIDSRLTLRFADGSLRDERAVFSQARVFRLERYRLLQQGRSFPLADVSFDRKTGRYNAVTREKDGTTERARGTLDMPADLYTGLTTTLLRNLPATGDTTVQTVVFTPKPRLVRMVLRREEEQQVTVAGAAATAVRYSVNLELGGLAGVLAPLVGKAPPTLHYWIVAGEIPVFARFEGPMFLNGPVWRVEQVLPRWPR
jgi:hypothetical protein